MSPTDIAVEYDVTSPTSTICITTIFLFGKKPIEKRRTRGIISKIETGYRVQFDWSSSYHCSVVLSFSCNFLLAARIISSLLFCKRRCLSVRFCDHALSWCIIVPELVLVTVCGDSDLTLSERLYRDIRSCACGLNVDREVELACVAGAEGAGNWG